MRLSLVLLLLLPVHCRPRRHNPHYSVDPTFFHSNSSVTVSVTAFAQEKFNSTPVSNAPTHFPPEKVTDAFDSTATAQETFTQSTFIPVSPTSNPVNTFGGPNSLPTEISTSPVPYRNNSNRVVLPIESGTNLPPDKDTSYPFTVPTETTTPPSDGGTFDPVVVPTESRAPPPSDSYTVNPVALPTETPTTPPLNTGKFSPNVASTKTPTAPSYKSTFSPDSLLTGTTVTSSSNKGTFSSDSVSTGSPTTPASIDKAIKESTPGFSATSTSVPHSENNTVPTEISTSSPTPVNNSTTRQYSPISIAHPDSSIDQLNSSSTSTITVSSHSSLLNITTGSSTLNYSLSSHNPLVITSNSSDSLSSIPTYSPTSVKEFPNASYTVSSYSPAPTKFSAPGLVYAPAVPTVTPTQPVSNPNGWLPSSIIIDSPSSTNSQSNPPSVSPTPHQDLPSLIVLANSTSPIPTGSTLVQVGFLPGLNYPFLVNNPLSSSQILGLLPPGLAFALQIPTDRFSMSSIQPFSVSPEQNDRAVVLFYMPSSQVDQLSNAIHENKANPTSRLYFLQTDPSVKQLTNLIDPSIPLAPKKGAILVPHPLATSMPQSPAEHGLPRDGSLGQKNTTPPSSSKPFGIISGAIVAATAYAVLVIFGARRYRRTREARSTVSIGSDSQRPNSNSSARSYHQRGQISGPMMSENSLGWT